MYKEQEYKKLKLEYLSFCFMYILVAVFLVLQTFGLERILNQENTLMWFIITLTSMILYFFTNRHCFIGRRVINQKMTYYLQEKLMKENFDRSYFDFEKMNAGEWITKLFNDIETVTGFYANNVLLLIIGTFEFLLSVLYGFIFSVELTLIILICSVFSVIVPKILQKHITETKNETQKKREGVNSFISNTVDNVAVIKNYKSTPFILRIFENKCQKYVDALIINRKANAINIAISYGLGSFINIIWIVAGILLIQNNKLNVPAFVGFVALSNQFAWPFYEIPSFIAQYTEMKVSKNRIKVPYQKYENEMTYEVMDNDIVVKAEDLTFSYDNKTNVIEKSNFVINKNERVAIVGESGRGKSTALKILLGLYDNFDGKVTWQKDTKISYIPQVNILFNGTIRENITFFDNSYKDDEIIEVCKQACIYDYIISLQNGLDEELGDIKLSNGQIQRVALARTLLTKPDVFILDEFSSSIDIETQEIIFENLKKVKGTFIMVLHKKEALGFCDRTFEI